jgi:hypothetical protein
VKTAPLLFLVVLKFWLYKLAPDDSQPWAYYTASGFAGMGLAAILMEQKRDVWPWVWTCAVWMIEEALQGICGLRALAAPFTVIPGESICTTQIGFYASAWSLAIVCVVAGALAAAVRGKR